MASRFLIAAALAAATTTALSQQRNLALETLGVSAGMPPQKVDAAMKAAGYESGGSNGVYYARYGLPERPQRVFYRTKQVPHKDPMHVPPMPDELHAVYGPIDSVVIGVHRKQKITDPVHIDKLQADLVAKWGQPTYVNGDTYYWISAETGTAKRPEAYRLAEVCAPSVLAESVSLEAAERRSACKAAVRVQVFPVLGGNRKIIDSLQITLADFDAAQKQMAKLRVFEKGLEKAQEEKSKSQRGPKL